MSQSSPKNILALIAKAEERDRELAFYKNMYMQMPLAMAFVGQDGCVVEANRKLANALGYNREDLIGTHFVDITHPDDVEKDVVEFSRLVRGEITDYKMEKRYLKQDGTPVKATLWVWIFDSKIIGCFVEIG